MGAMDTPEGWAVEHGKLRRTFTFHDFSEAWGFMSRVALAAERAGHHPDWSNSWNRVTIELVTHDEGATVTQKDVSLAEAINRLV